MQTVHIPSYDFLDFCFFSSTIAKSIVHIRESCLQEEAVIWKILVSSYRNARAFLVSYIYDIRQLQLAFGSAAS